jgi:serine/threonine-protein kinase
MRTFNNMGTLFYMAPERFRRGFRSSVASDMFSLGMIMLEMLVGKLPFGEEMHPVASILTTDRSTATAFLCYNLP